MPEMPVAGTVPVAVTLALGEVVRVCRHVPQCGCDRKPLGLVGICVNCSWVWFCCFWLVDVEPLLNRLHSLSAFVPHLACFYWCVVCLLCYQQFLCYVRIDEDLKIRLTPCFTLKVWSWKNKIWKQFQAATVVFSSVTILLPASHKSLPSVWNLSDSTLSLMTKQWKAI